MPTQQQTFQTQIGIGKETTWATGVVPTSFLALNNPKPKDDIGTILDEGYRGLPAKDFGYYQGVRHSEFDLPDHLFYPDDSGHLLMGMMGNDAISGSNPYIHAIALASVLPPSYSVTDYSGLTAGGNSRRYVGMYFESLELRWVSSGKFMATAKLQGKVSASQAKPVASYSSVNVFRTWDGALTLNSVATSTIQDFSLRVKRPLEVLYGSGGSQDPIGIVPGRMEVTGTATVAPTDETELNLYLNNTQGAFSFLFNAGASAQLTIQMTKCAFETPTVVERSKEYVSLVVAFRGISNATDVSSGGAGAGPVKFSLINARSTAY